MHCLSQSAHFFVGSEVKDSKCTRCWQQSNYGYQIVNKDVLDIINWTRPLILVVGTNKLKLWHMVLEFALNCWLLNRKHMLCLILKRFSCMLRRFLDSFYMISISECLFLWSLNHISRSTRWCQWNIYAH